MSVRLGWRGASGLLVGFYVAMTAAACSGPKAASQLKIRNGSEVTSANNGPERYATAGLTAYTDGGSYTCSAALVSPSVLVTAAHCVSPGARIFAYFGPDMSRASANEFTAVDAVAVNPDFDQTAVTGSLPLNDVALLHLAKPAPRGYRPVAILPDESGLRQDQPVELAGYGITEQGDDSGVLRYVLTTYVGPDQQGRLQINDSARRGACSGDSGGPLFGQVDGTTYVAGVLSGGPIPCRGVNLYTSLALQRPFLDQAAGTFGVSLR